MQKQNSPIPIGLVLIPRSQRYDESKSELARWPHTATIVAPILHAYLAFTLLKQLGSYPMPRDLAPILYSNVTWRSQQTRGFGRVAHLRMTAVGVSVDTYLGQRVLLGDSGEESSEDADGSWG